MGIVTDPGYEMWGVNFPDCFPIGSTPLKMYLSVQGLGVNAQTPPLAEEPPNGIWLLEQKLGFPFIWELTTPKYFFELMLDAANSALEIEDNEGLCFGAWFQGACALHYMNVGQPESHFTGGIAVCSPRPDFGPRPTLKGGMELLNITPAAKTFAELFPHPDGDIVLKYNRKSDKTNVKIKIDPTLY